MQKMIKFCGISKAEQLKEAIDLGVHAVGLVFFADSPRAVSIEQAQELVKQVPAFITIVALVVNMSAEELSELAEKVPFDVLQFHGLETPQACADLAKMVNKRWIKALRVNTSIDKPDMVKRRIQAYANAGASSVILDTYHQDKFGGTGENFDWSLIPQNSPLPVVLAGGLTPDNVAETLGLPICGVDVSGGIEVTKGEKDPEKMRNFVNAMK